jgi:hypothetical protein
MRRITMRLAEDPRDASGLQDLTFEMCAAVNAETDAEATVAERQGESGDKGGVIEAGTIILALLGSGGVAVSLVNVWKSYVERGRHISVELKREDGRAINIKADNLDDSQVEQTLRLVREFIGGER